MRIDQLLSPGLLTMGIQLRTQAAMAISGLQIAAQNTPTKKAPNASKLKAFFLDCAAKCDPLIDIVVPTVLTRKKSATPAEIVITYSEPVNGKPLVGAYALAGSPALTVTAVEVKGSTVVVTASGAVIAGTHTIAYTQPTPVAQKVKDGAGNAAASFAASAVAVA